MAHRQRWERFAMLWAWIAAPRAAWLLQVRLAYAETLIDHRNALIATADRNRALRGDEGGGLWFAGADRRHVPLLDQLTAEIRRTSEELARYVYPTRLDYLEHAEPGETLEATELRLLVEVTGSPGLIARTAEHRVGRDRTAERRRDDLVRDLQARRAWYAAREAQLPSELAAARAAIDAEISRIDSMLQRLT